jgi:hypothetical protein
LNKRGEKECQWEREKGKIIWKILRRRSEEEWYMKKREEKGKTNRKILRKIREEEWFVRRRDGKGKINRDIHVRICVRCTRPFPR